MLYDKKYNLIRERLQICSIFEYLDSINDGSNAAIEDLKKHSMKLQVGSTEMEIQLDQNSFDVIYNMLLELRNVNALKMR